MTEVWRPINGFEGAYEISNLGRLKSLPKWRNNRFGGYLSKELISIGRKTTKGYLAFEFTDKLSRPLHRLVAIAFIPNVDSKEQVNHLNGIKTDNRAENLEWCTNGENGAHAYRIGLKVAAYKGKFGKDHNQSKPVIATRDGVSIEFESKTACGLHFNVSVQAVAQAIKYGMICKGHSIKELNYAKSLGV